MSKFDDFGASYIRDFTVHNMHINIRRLYKWNPLSMLEAQCRFSYSRLVKAAPANYYHQTSDVRRTLIGNEIFDQM